MKRYHSFLMTLLAALLLAAPTRAYEDDAFASLPFTGAAGVTTVVTDTEGAVHSFDGALDASALAEQPAEAAKIASYSLAYEGETLLTVALNGFEESAETLSLLGEGFQSATNGFYSVEFDYTENEQDYTVYMTGLKIDQVSEAQEARIAALTEQIDGIGVGSYGKIGGLSFVDFIDAEKLATRENIPENEKFYCNDSELCWAATTSDILYYTGWAQNAEGVTLQSEDDVMDLFHANFEDGAGHVRFGLEWFFNGNFGPDDTVGYPRGNGANDIWARRKPDSTDGGYYPTCSPLFYYENLRMTREQTEEEAVDVENAGTAFDRLRDGFGVGLAMGWYDTDTYARDGGHAVALWGYIVKKDAEAFDKGDYVALLIGDPDSDAVNDTPPSPAGYPEDYQKKSNRREAPNMLCLMPIDAEGCRFTGTTANGTNRVDSWWIHASATKVGVVEEFITLRPYTTDYFHDNGTFNNETTPDLDMTDTTIYILEDPSELTLGVAGDNDDPLAERVTFAQGNELWVNLWSLWNNSRVACDATSVEFTVELRKPDDNSFVTRTFDGSVVFNGLTPGQIKYGRADSISLGVLEAGTYALSAVVGKADGVTEAYYFNNFTKDFVFTVTDEAYDVSGADVDKGGHIVDTGETTKEGNAIYSFPLELSGVNMEDVKAVHVISGFMWNKGENWSDVYRAKSFNDPAETPSAMMFLCSFMRVRVLLQLKDSVRQPWPVLEKEFDMSDLKETYRITYDENPGIYCECTFNLLTKEIEFFNDYMEISYLYAAGYDQDGRMVFLTAPQFEAEYDPYEGWYRYDEETQKYVYDEDDGEYVLYMVRIPLPKEVKTVKLFWFWNESGTDNGASLGEPMCACTEFTT